MANEVGDVQVGGGLLVMEKTTKEDETFFATAKIQPLPEYLLRAEVPKPRDERERTEALKTLVKRLIGKSIVVDKALGEDIFENVRQRWTKGAEAGTGMSWRCQRRAIYKRSEKIRPRGLNVGWRLGESASNWTHDTVQYLDES